MRTCKSSTRIKARTRELANFYFSKNIYICNNELVKLEKLNTNFQPSRRILSNTILGTPSTETCVKKLLQISSDYFVNFAEILTSCLRKFVLPFVVFLGHLFLRVSRLSQCTVHNVTCSHGAGSTGILEEKFNSKHD